MYKILVDGKTFCDSRVDDLAIINPVVNLEVNSAGSMSFTIPPEHPFYDAIKRRKSVVSVYRDNESNPIFQGICTEESIDFYKQKKIECDGELAYLNDSIQRQAKYQDRTVLSLLTTYIENHNAQVEESKRFEIGNVTVTSDYIYCFTNMETTLECIKNDLVDDFGGYLRIRYANGHKYIDYLADSPKTAVQTIELGKNLLSYESNIDDTEIATRIIPLGAKIDNPQIEELEQRLDIKSVNDNLDYVESTTAIENLGIITQVVVFDNVNTASALKTKGQAYLNEIQFENVVIEVGAIDLGYLTDQFDKFELLDYIHVISSAHGMNKWFTLTEMTLNLNQPENDKFTLGQTKTLSLSAQTNDQNAEITRIVNETPTTSYMSQAIKQATSLLSGAEGGYIKIQTDEDGKPYEILIMDTDDTATAEKVWRWNQNGFGFSANGYDGDYALAMTMNGEIVADFITSGTMRADIINGGVFKVGGELNRNGEIQIYDENGVLCGVINNGGMAIYSPTTQTQTIISPAVGLSVRDAEGNDYFGYNFREDVQFDFYPTTVVPNFTYSDGTHYTGVTNQPIKIVGIGSCFDEDEKQAVVTSTYRENYMTYNNWLVTCVHSNVGYNNNPKMVPKNVTSQSYTTEDGSIRYKPKIMNAQSRVIQLPDNFKNREVAISIDVSYNNPYSSGDDYIYSYTYANLKKPKCYEGATAERTLMAISTFDEEFVTSTTIFPESYSHESTYIEPLTYVPDDEKEIFESYFSFPASFYDYNVDYVWDKEAGTITISAWALGRYKTNYNSQEAIFCYDFIDMTEFMKIRVMATT